MEALHFPADVDAIILSHTHTDHVGAYPQAAKRNPEAVIYCPEGNKDAIGIMVREAWKRRMSVIRLKLSKNIKKMHANWSKKC